MTLGDKLIAAKALIATPEKWGKGKYKHDGRRCALIAIDHGGAGYAGHMALREALPGDFACILAFNDHPDTTHADIMALFDRAIAAAVGSTEGSEQK